MSDITTADRLGEQLINKGKMNPNLAKDINKIRYGTCTNGEKKKIIKKITKILAR